MRPLGPVPFTCAEIDAELARELAHRRGGVGERLGRSSTLDRRRRCRGALAGGQRGAAHALRRRGSGCRLLGPAPPLPRRASARPVSDHACPRETLSPTLTAASDDAASGAGTSIVALSVSSVTSALLGLHGVARLHQDLDDRDVLEVADVRARDSADAAVGARSAARRRRADRGPVALGGGAAGAVGIERDDQRCPR